MTYKKIKCPFCDAEITSGGAARTSHMRSHVRKGELTEEDTGSGLEWVTKKGERIVFDKPKKVYHRVGSATGLKSLDLPSRIQVEVIETKHGAYAFCPSCGKKTKLLECPADDRFRAARCGCGKTSLVSRRYISHDNS